MKNNIKKRPDGAIKILVSRAWYPNLASALSRAARNSLAENGLTGDTTRDRDLAALQPFRRGYPLEETDADARGYSHSFWAATYAKRKSR